jgi:hypothetical protein
VRQCRRRVRGEAGQATMEFLLVVPFVFLFLFFMVEGANVVKTWMIVEGASREGARCGAVRKTQADVKTCAVNASGGVLTTSNVTVTNAQGTVGSAVQVAITYTYTFKTPLLAFLHTYTGGTIPNTMALSAQTQMRLEEQTT